jgi:SAM-dependent methyltransferase
VFAYYFVLSSNFKFQVPFVHKFGVGMKKTFIILLSLFFFVFLFQNAKITSNVQKTYKLSSQTHFDQRRLAAEKAASVLERSPIQPSFHISSLPPSWDTLGKDFPRNIILQDYHDWIIDLLPGKNFSGKFIWDSLATADDPEWLYHSKQEGFRVDSCKHDGNVDLSLCDLHIMDMKKQYDLIIISQTFEHLYDPIQAAAVLYKHLKPGGLLFSSQPIFNRAHMVPFHFQHFSLSGLVLLFDSVGFDIVNLGSWGSKRYVDLVLESNFWPDTRSFDLANVRNDPSCLVQTWTLLRRPLVEKKVSHSSARLNRPGVSSSAILKIQKEFMINPVLPSAEEVSALIKSYPSLANVDFISLILLAVAKSVTSGSVALLGNTSLQLSEGDVVPSIYDFDCSNYNLLVLSEFLENRLDDYMELKSLKDTFCTKCPLLKFLITLRAFMPLSNAIDGYIKAGTPTLLLKGVLDAGFRIERFGWWSNKQYASRYSVTGNPLTANEFFNIYEQQTESSVLESLLGTGNHTEFSIGDDLHRQVISWAVVTC